MQCEMCGETIRGIPKLIRVEGAELQVCSRCGKFGTEVQQPRRTDVQRPAARPARGPGPRRRRLRHSGNGTCSITWKAISSRIMPNG